MSENLKIEKILEVLGRPSDEVLAEIRLLLPPVRSQSDQGRTARRTGRRSRSD